ncbi:MAG: hopanoid biosynthesis-associated RND transporter HpnN [Alphaproteobacteria bacterium]|nr:MAG: hopanoid biosynthesis-associated RND transporter HpnN [Alphaproteobacteria bacterium]
MPTRAGNVTVAAIARLVQLSSRYAWPTILGLLLLAVVSATYFTRHFAIITDSKELLSSSLAWRQQEKMLHDAFPQRIDQIIAVIDASTPEGADDAAEILVNGLASRPDVIRSVSRPDGGEFFERDGILLLGLDEVQHSTADLIAAQPFLGTLAADPTLRGVFRTLSQSLEGVRLGKAKLEDLKPAFAALADAFELLAKGETPAFSWRELIAGRPPKPSELRRFVNIEPALNFGDLQPGGKATAVIREVATSLGLTAERGIKVRLTGPVVLSDEEFATVADGAVVNGLITLLLVGLVLWLALRRARLIFAVLVTLVCGLLYTSAIGLWAVGALNLISVAFAVLFVGLGVDFGIQFCVRYRSERHACRDLEPALLGTARGMAAPLLLAAASIATAFFSFLPTAYRGLSELGLIAGIGIVIALATTLTLLPALLTVLQPPPEQKPIGFAALGCLDRFLENRRNWVVGTTLAVAILGLPLLAGLRFDFNPLNLRAQDGESVVTLLDLMQVPDTSPNTIDVLKSNLAEASATAEKLRQLPEVGRVLTLQSFVPDDQDAKLALIEDASFFLQNTLNPDQADTQPTPADTRAEIGKLVVELDEAVTPTAMQARRLASVELDGVVRDLNSPTAVQARRLARALEPFVHAPPAALDEAQHALIAPLSTTLRQARHLLGAERVSIETLPPELKKTWMSTDGRFRVEVAPKGDAIDNAVLHRFVAAVASVAPEAAGTPVFMIEAAATVVKAFLQAGILSLVLIALILFVALRRWIDVALTLVPLLVAIVVTLEICVMIGLRLNFANIIALPLLLGIGVAFKIYYIIAWRAGETNFLQSSLTRAILFSACTTAIAFGSLWFSHHPGTSSMGKLMGLSLLTTLAAAVVFQPALMATQRKCAVPKQSSTPGMK